MNPAYAHLVLNHFPLIGVIFALALGTIALIRSQSAVLRTSFWLLLVSGVVALPTYVSGNSAEDIVEDYGANHDYLEAHEDAGKLAAIFAGILGGLALVGLVWFRRRDIGRPYAVLVLVAALFTGGYLAYTANLGGKIMHPEIRSETPATPAGTSYDDRDHD